jgi:hypothetical protein
MTLRDERTPVLHSPFGGVLDRTGKEPWHMSCDTQGMSLMWIHADSARSAPNAEATEQLAALLMRVSGSLVTAAGARESIDEERAFVTARALVAACATVAASIHARARSAAGVATASGDQSPAAS